MTMSELHMGTDEALVLAARSGKREAWDELASRYFGLVYAIGLGRLRDRDLAEDLAQEVFLRVCLLLDQLDHPALFSHWVTRVARNLAIDWQRRGERASRLLPMIPISELPPEFRDRRAECPREAASAAEGNAALADALDRLQPEQRELVLLHYMEGLSHREIAIHLGINQATVTRHLAKALALMRGTVDSVLSDMARGLRARPDARVRAISLGTAALLLPAATRTALAATASQAVQATAAASAAEAAKVSAGGGVMALVGTILSFAKAGGVTVGTGKTVAAGIVACAVIGGSIYHFTRPTETAPSRGIIVSPDSTGTTATATISGRNDQQDASVDRPLAQAILSFNQRAGMNPIGRMQPPLTEKEVIAAIRGWMRENTPADERTYQVFQKVAQTGIVPAGMSFDFTTAWRDVNGHDISVWWVDFRADYSRMNAPDVPAGSGGYVYRIRAQFLDSRPHDASAP